MAPSRIPLEVAGQLVVASLADIATRTSSETSQDFDRVVCLVEQGELAPYPEYAHRVETSSAIVHFPIVDHGVRDIADIVEIAEQIADNLRDGESVVVHCHAGFGRSSLVAVTTLVQLGYGADEALALLKAARPKAGPESEAQLRFMAELAALGH